MLSTGRACTRRVQLRRKIVSFFFYFVFNHYNIRISNGFFWSILKLFHKEYIFYYYYYYRLSEFIWTNNGCRRRESTDVEDLFIAHVSGMDTLARGLRNVAKLIEVRERISFWQPNLFINSSLFSLSLKILLTVLCLFYGKKDGALTELVRKRYESFDTEIGAQIEVCYFILVFLLLY